MKKTPMDEYIDDSPGFFIIVYGEIGYDHGTSGPVFQKFQWG